MNENVALSNENNNLHVTNENLSVNVNNLTGENSRLNQLVTSEAAEINALRVENTNLVNRCANFEA
jgi:predicted nuclease with TOPRIM domain